MWPSYCPVQSCLGGVSPLKRWIKEGCKGGVKEVVVGENREGGRRETRGMRWREGRIYMLHQLPIVHIMTEGREERSKVGEERE